MFLWKRKTTDLEKVKSQTHDAIAEADRNITKLNKLLKANGITLKIYRASHNNQ